MSKKFYVICDDDCKIEGMSKEQIFAAIAEATGNAPTSVDDAFITKIKEGNAGNDASLWIGTQAEFNAVAPETSAFVARVDAEGKIYIIATERLSTYMGDNLMISEASVGFGKGNTAGLSGYYYSAIDFNKKMITLSTEQGKTVTPTEPIAWSVGDVVTIVNGTKYELCATITAINGNVITVNNIPFTSIVADSAPGFDDWSICVPAKPDAGVVDLGKCAVAFGDNNKALNWAAFASGRDNVVTSQYGTALGRGNKVDGYSGFATGKGNEIAPNCHFANVTGTNNKVSGTAATAEGANNEASADFAHAGGNNTKATEKYQTVFGANNAVDKDALFIIGGGINADGSINYDKPSNLFVVKKNGEVWALNANGDKVKLVDTTYLGQTIWSKVDDSRAVKSGVALSTILRSGFYKLSDTHPDMPSGCAWGQMIVSADSASQVQFVFPTGGKIVYHRRATSGKYPSTWDSFSVSDTDRPLSTATQAELNKKFDWSTYGENTLTDCNTALTPGKYRVTGGSSIKNLLNKPAGVDTSYGAQLIVLQGYSANYVIQLFFSGTSCQFYYRTFKTDEVIPDWKEISSVGHTHSNYALKDHTHSNYALKDHTHDNTVVNAFPDSTSCEVQRANYYIVTIDYGGSLVTVPVSSKSVLAGRNNYSVPVHVKTEGTVVGCELNVRWTGQTTNSFIFTAVSGTIDNIQGYN